MNEPDLDRFSRPLWGERPFREPTEDELAEYKEQDDDRREERARYQEALNNLAERRHDPLK